MSYYYDGESTRAEMIRDTPAEDHTLILLWIVLNHPEVFDAAVEDLQYREALQRRQAMSGDE